MTTPLLKKYVDKDSAEKIWNQLSTNTTKIKVNLTEFILNNREKH